MPATPISLLALALSALISTALSAPAPPPPGLFFPSSDFVAASSAIRTLNFTKIPHPDPKGRAHAKRHLDERVYGDHPVAQRRQSAGATATTIPLQMLGQGTAWLANIEIGTPPVTYSVLVDTGSADLWVMSDNCFSGGCAATARYVGKDSSTANITDVYYQQSFMNQATLSNTVVFETVSWGGLQVKNQIVGVVYDITIGIDATFGIVGLGNPGLAYGPYFYEKATGEMPMPFFQNLVSELGLESVYGMVVNPNGGQITIGGLDWSHIYENAQDNVGMAWQEMLPEPTGATSFYITMGNMSINNVIVPASINQPVTVDTGASGIIVPCDILSTFYENVPNSFLYASDFQPTAGPTDFNAQAFYNNPSTYAGAARSASGFMFTAYPCSQGPAMSIGMTPRVYDLSTAAFSSIGSFDDSGTKYCIGAVMCSAALGSAADGAPWVLGDAFLQEVYTAFAPGNNSIGFAPYVASY